MATDAVANQSMSISQRHMEQLNLSQKATKPATPPGGQELINISRNDIIDGQDVVYSPIKNLKDLYIQYNPNNIIRLESTSDTYFKNFPIKLENKLPAYGTGPNGEVVYIDPTTGDMVINVSSLDPDEQVDIQILDSGDTLNGTIYE